MPANRWIGTAPAVGQLVVITLVAALLAALVTTPSSRAAFVDTTGATANSATAASCFSTPTVQSGTASNTANGAQTIAISAVDPARAFLLFSTRHDSNRPVGSVLGGQLASATTIEFHRNTDEGSPVPITVRWYVVEYPCGVSVQRGTVAQTATTVDVAISPVAALSQAFVTFSKTVAATDSSWDGNDQFVVDLTSTSNVQIRSQATGSDHTTYWQVVEFTDPTKISVQRGTTSIPSGSTTATVTIPSAVDTTRASPLVSSRVDPQDLDETLLRTRLLSSTTLEISRALTTNDVDEISWQVVELLDGSTVQHFHTQLDPAVASSTVSISAVDLGRATAFAGTQNGGGQNGGRTTYFDDDIIGVASATFSLTSPTLVSVERTSTVDLGSFGWQVVEWGN